MVEVNNVKFNRITAISQNALLGHIHTEVPFLSTLLPLFNKMLK